jgi:hypothetical protein
VVFLLNPKEPRNWMDGGGSFSFKKNKLFFSNAWKPKLL